MPPTVAHQPDPKRVLVIDDEPDIREIATMALDTVGGLSVEACASGREALERVDAFAPDVVLLDVMMPDMDGPAVLHGLRRTHWGRDVPVIFLTATVRPDEVLRLQREGAIDVLAKPFDPMTLTEQVVACYRTAMTERADARATQVDARRAQLRERFRQRLRSERETIRALIKAFLDMAGDGASGDDLHQRAHRLAGTASTVGFEALGSAAASLDDAMDTSDALAARTAAEQFMAELERAIDTQ